MRFALSSTAPPRAALGACGCPAFAAGALQSLAGQCTDRGVAEEKLLVDTKEKHAQSSHHNFKRKPADNQHYHNEQQYRTKRPKGYQP